MKLEREIPFITDEGYEYLVSFIEFRSNGIDFDIPIVDVSITLMNKDIECNSTKTLNKFTDIIDEYLKEHNVRSNRKEKLLPQEFRSKLFSSMFNQRNYDNYILKEIRISDSERGDHFTSLISGSGNIDTIELIENELQKFNK